MSNVRVFVDPTPHIRPGRTDGAVSQPPPTLPPTHTGRPVTKVLAVRARRGFAMRFAVAALVGSLMALFAAARRGRALAHKFDVGKRCRPVLTSFRHGSRVADSRHARELRPDLRADCSPLCACGVGTLQHRESPLTVWTSRTTRPTNRSSAFIIRPEYVTPDVLVDH